MSTKEMITNHLRNRVWASLDELADDIIRIGQEMTPACRDEAIVQKTLLGVGGLLMQRRAEAKQLEGK